MDINDYEDNLKWVLEYDDYTPEFVFKNYSRQLHEFPGAECWADTDGIKAIDAYVCATPCVTENLWYFRIEKKDHSKVARISMTEPSYITCTDVMCNWILSDEEIGHMTNYLQSSCKDSPRYSVWEMLIVDYNTQLEFNYAPELDKVPEDLPIPDYTKLPSE